ncbi:2-oxo acid dehydrogenase subunit E2 [Labrenzia sp. OB1]|uniref:2-oxo acid dehydrogenase subunit E2 n=1 Tax=Labrenzia sp. OB1 TaxID=1561204 RepID=UPI00083881A9|nr:2-oxo acid dehydrogenase subunit E2 [Labrenzia sp. OB1]
MTRVTASPSVRALAGRKGIDLEDLGRSLGRRTLAREDVEAAVSGSKPGAGLPASGPDHATFWDVDHSAYGPIREEPMSRFARVSARNLAAANALVPQVTHHDEADTGAIEAFRKTLKVEAAENGVRLTALAFHVKALAHCLKRFETFNASLSPDGATLYLKDYVHIGIAVDTPYGLTVPVVRDADRKGLFELARDISTLAAKAAERKLPPDALGGASMSISNLGGIGGTAFTPIVNPPEVTILGITRTRIQPVWDGEAFQPRPVVPLDLSYDHRVINGAEAARFLAEYASLIGEPQRLLL